MPLSGFRCQRDASSMYKIDVLDRPISVGRAQFLDGRVECPDCRAHVRPTFAVTELVRTGTSTPAAAWCSVCCSTHSYVMRPGRSQTQS